MAEPVRSAVVGASGGMGKSRVRQFQADPRARVVAACARDIDRLRAATEGASIRLTSDADEVYAAADVDAVAISISNTRHYDHAKRALLAGKHVLCEYPLADRLDQFDELVDLAGSRGLVLHHSLTTRSESLHRAMKAALPEVGEPRAAYYRYYGTSSWYVDPALRGDAFCALHIHFIDQFVDFFGWPASVAAHGVERDGKVSAVAMMQWRGGLTGTVEFAMGFADRPAYMGTVVGTEGWCGFGQPDMRVTVVRAGTRREIEPGPDCSRDEDAVSFLDEVLGTGGPQRDLADARRIIALCLDCSRQVRESGAPWH